MKIKEIPLSIYHSLKLKSLKLNDLKTPKEDSLPVIVSLTSIPSRLKKVNLTIRSILNQVNPPKKIVLWLNEADKTVIPKSLSDLEGPRFEIRYTPLFCSHKKLIHTLKAFPEDIIVTCDDDFIYDKNWLVSLYEDHLENPKNIIAHHTRQIQYDDHKKLLPYKQWNFNNPKKDKAILAIGAGGILYPPKSLNPIVTDVELFLKLAPKADDLWFKAMSLINGVQVLQSKNPPKRLIPLIGTQKISLKKENVDKDLNLKQWQQLADHFNLELE